jgi:hypothetical protein
MDNTISLSHDELQLACQEYVIRRAQAQDPYHGYTGHLHITPLQVDHILAADEVTE